MILSQAFGLRQRGLICGLLLVCGGLIARADVALTEFMANNNTTLADDFGQFEDWIEIHNTGTTNVSLLDWALTDSVGNPSKWQFPATNLPPGSHLVVFASNRNRKTVGMPLHTNFKISASGGYLALRRPDGSVATEFNPYPAQAPDVSYGFGVQVQIGSLVTNGSPARWLVPTSDVLGTSWTARTFNDGSWNAGTNALGYSAETNFATDLLAGAPRGYWRLNEAITNGGAVNLGTLGSVANGAYAVNVAVNVPAQQSPAAPGFEPSNTCGRFNGINSRMEIPYQAALNPNGPFSVEFWVKPAVNNGSFQSPVCSQYFSSSSRAGYIFYQNAATSWEFRLGNSTSASYVAIAAGGTPMIGAWQHLVGVYDGATASLYLNGVLVSSVGLTSAFVPNPSQVFRVGATGNGGGTYFFNGDLDELAFFNRALTSAEVGEHYAAATQSSWGYTNVIRSNVRTALQSVNSSLYCRMPFVLTNTAVDDLQLLVQCDDGFAAYLNGQLVAMDRSPAYPTWNSQATSSADAAGALAGELFELGGYQSALVVGTNVLAFQGMNTSAGDTDFLLGATLTSTQFGAMTTTPRYFVQPTPGELNTGGSTDLGPIISATGYFPFAPTTNDNLTVTCRVAQAFAPIANVTLYWRVMFSGTTSVAMFDDGAHGDGAAGDGVFGATINKANYAASQMVRWFITAGDTSAHTTRWPLFADPLNSAEYLGTVIQTNYVNSPLPVLHLFAPASVLQPGPTTSQTGADSQSGGRVSAFFDGEFYDNIAMSLRGNSTAGYNKKSHRIEFNAEHQFRHAGGGARLRHTSFTADYPDPTYQRQGLAFWLDNAFGSPAPFYDPYRLQLNGQFYQLANHNDVHGDELLERLGYDPDGALYNAAGTIQTSQFSTGGFEKKTRRWEGNADYTTLAAAIAESVPAGQRAANLFDRLDLPQVISYLVVARFVHENDDVWANMSLYHDNDGDDLWRIIPFDMNLSWGAAYLDDSSLSGIQVTNDFLKSHPLYGSSQTPWTPGGNWNRLYDAIFQTPSTRAMFLRRLRTFLDTWVKPPGTPANQLPIEAKVFAWRDRIAADAAADRAWWGWPGYGGQNNFPVNLNLTDGVNSLLNDFLARRRSHFYGKHCITNTALPVGIASGNNAGIPLSQPTNAVVNIVGWDFNPVSGNQDEEYVTLANPNAYAVDVSGWKLGGGVTHTLQPGTVIPASGALYLTPNSRAFRQRAVAPRGGMGLFVQGSYKGHLSAWGETLTLMDDTGRMVSSNSFAGAPSDAQRYLRVTEIMYNPSPAPAINSDPQQFEFIELRNVSTNVTLDLTGVRFTNGIAFSFIGSAALQLAPGARVLLVRNTVAFTARYGSGLPVAGQFAGALDNAGETLRLEDASGEKILEFAYDNKWYPITDGLGFSLVIVNDLAHWSTWGQKSSWRTGGTLGGAPGAVDPDPAVGPVLVNEVLAHTDLPDHDSIELFNPTATNVNIGGWFLTDDFFAPKKYRIADGTSINAGAYLVFNDTQFNAGSNAFLFSEYGDEAYLFSADAATNLTGYVHGFDFPESPNGVSFGRYVNSRTNTMFVLQSTRTLGATNAIPLVGPVVISEIMYHPPDLTNGVDNDLDEFIELQNIATTNVPLFCVFTNEPGYGLAARTNTWRLRDAVDFDFPTNVTLAASNRLLIVGFNPTNTAVSNAFRARYSVPDGVAIFGPWNGKLDNSGDKLELKYPDRPDVTSSNAIVPYVMVEKVSYADGDGWPTNADGDGLSLQRINLSTFGNDPINWIAAAPSAGQTNVPPPVPDADSDGMADAWELAHGLIVGLDDSGLDPDADGASNLQQFLAGTDPKDSASVFRFTAIETSGSQVVMSFTAISNVSYTLQSRGIVNSGVWTNVSSVPALATNRVVRLTNSAAASSSRWFRLAIP